MPISALNMSAYIYIYIYTYSFSAYLHIRYLCDTVSYRSFHSCAYIDIFILVLQRLCTWIQVLVVTQKSIRREIKKFWVRTVVLVRNITFWNISLSHSIGQGAVKHWNTHVVKWLSLYFHACKVCSFTRGCDGNIDIVSTLINSELNKIADWLAVNKLSLNVQKTKFMIFHYRQRVLTENDIPCLMINNTLIERVTEFNFLGLTVNEYMNWNSHTQKIANKISRTLGVMNRLKRYLPISAMQLMYDSLILSHLQFGITSWGFEGDRISKLQKRALRIMTNSKYNAHTDPLFKRLHLLKVNDIFDVQCLKFWYKFVNKKLPNYFRDMFKYNYELHEIGTRSHDQLHLYPTRTSGARNVLRHHIPELLNKFPKYLTERIKTHSLYSIFYNIKCYLIDLYNYNCTIIDCYICNNNNWVTNRLSGNLGPAAGPWSQAAARVVDMTASGVGGDLRMVTGF